MRIQYCSDLHLEFPENSLFLKNNPIEPLGEVLILAGDIIYMEEQFFNHDFFDFCSTNYRETYMICGNHEFYNGVDVSLFRESFCNSIRKNVFIVNNYEIAIDGVKFIFSTLWSIIHFQNRWKIKNQLNDFYRIKYQHEILSIDKYNSLFDSSFDFIIKALLNNKHKKTVIVTHHAPSPLCNAIEHRNSPLNDAFVVDLTNFIYDSTVDYWIYGHTHRNVDEVDVNGTKLITNQLGYVQMNEYSLFKQDKIFEI